MKDEGLSQIQAHTPPCEPAFLLFTLIHSFNSTGLAVSRMREILTSRSLSRCQLLLAGICAGYGDRTIYEDANWAGTQRGRQAVSLSVSVCP
jgi:hypothetical protein